jgi:hypothetical protein
MNQPSLEPIRDPDLTGFCQFLVENLSQQRTAEEWARAFLHDWGVKKPNNGFLLRDDGQIVGGIGAIYAERLIRGKAEKFCNINFATSPVGAYSTGTAPRACAWPWR